MHTAFRGLFIACLLVLLPASFAATQIEYELPDDLQAEIFLPEALWLGEHHRVESKVRNDGLFNQYSLKSSFGRFDVKTTTLLRIRIREIEAISAMRGIETGDTAVEALKRSGQNSVTGAKNLLVHPVRTLGNAALMVEQLYTRTTGTVRRNASDAEGGAFSQLVGLAKVKGEIANRFGVNMYSRNPVLQQELDRLARAAFLGGLSVRLATSVASSFAPVMGSVLLTTSSAARLVNEMINSTPPAEMWLQNKRTLLAMGLGLSEDKIENFLNRGVFSPAMQTILVASLSAMDGVKNRVLFIKLALDVGSGSRAQLITELAVMSAAFHKNVEAISEFTPMAKLLSAVTTAGVMHVLLPADYMIWSQQNARVLDMMSNRAGGGKYTGAQLWMLGEVSGKMRTHLLSRDWRVHTRAGRMLRPDAE